MAGTQAPGPFPLTSQAYYMRARLKTRAIELQIITLTWNQVVASPAIQHNSCFIHNSSKPEATHVHQLANSQTVVYPHNRIISINKKKSMWPSTQDTQDPHQRMFGLDAWLQVTIPAFCQWRPWMAANIGSSSGVPNADM